MRRRITLALIAIGSALAMSLALTGPANAHNAESAIEQGCNANGRDYDVIGKVGVRNPDTGTLYGRTALARAGGNHYCVTTWKTDGAHHGVATDITTQYRIHVDGEWSGWREVDGEYGHFNYIRFTPPSDWYMMDWRAKIQHTNGNWGCTPASFC